MTYQHRTLALGRWFSLSLSSQMANIGSEVERTINWKNKGNDIYSQQALYRALELLAITIDDKKNRKRLKELTRLREALLDYFIGKNQFFSSDKLWRQYFLSFNYAARIGLQKKISNENRSNAKRTLA